MSDDATSPYDGPRGRCPLSEYHHGTGFQLIRHDERIRTLEAELARVSAGWREVNGRLERAASKTEGLREECDALKNENTSHWLIRSGYRKEIDALKARIAELEAAAPHVQWELGISAASGCVHCQEMSGGGRESGETEHRSSPAGNITVSRREGTNGCHSASEASIAAANPAAPDWPSYADGKNRELCPECDEYSFDWAWWARDRIRELEKECGG